MKRGSVRVVYVCPRVGRCRDVYSRWEQTLGIGLGLRIGQLGFGGDVSSALTPRKDGTCSCFTVLIVTIKIFTIYSINLSIFIHVNTINMNF